MRKQRLGDFLAYTVGGDDGHGGGTGPLVILLHGFGAPGYDLVDLGSMLDVPDQVRFLFPEAPLTLPGSPGRAWWMLDMELFERRARGERVDRSEELPESLEALSAQLANFLDEAYEKFGVGPDQVVLGGFSQGSMLACDVALQARNKPAGLLLLSSTLIARARWEAAMPSCTGLKVFQSHGHTDALLHFADAERLAALFRKSGADLTFVDFPGGHELPPKVLLGASQFLRDTLYPTR